MRISVIIPTYKPKQYLWECINSIIKQTLTDDFEIILVLNGEKEPYWSEICDYLRIADRYHRVIFLYSDIANVSNARNIGLEHAKGEYITFIDDDDYISESYLEELLKCSSRTTIGCARPTAFDENGAREYSLEKAWNSIGCEKQIPFNKARKLFQGPCMKLFHKSIIEKRRFNLAFRNGEDALYMFLISDNFKYVSATPINAIYYRRIRKDGAAYSHKSFLYRLQNSTKLTVNYFKIYLSNPLKYSFLFLITRVLGAVKMCLR